MSALLAIAYTHEHCLLAKMHRVVINGRGELVVQRVEGALGGRCAVVVRCSDATPLALDSPVTFWTEQIIHVHVVGLRYACGHLRLVKIL